MWKSLGDNSVRFLFIFVVVFLWIFSGKFSFRFQAIEVSIWVILGWFWPFFLFVNRNRGSIIQIMDGIFPVVEQWWLGGKKSNFPKKNRRSLHRNSIHVIFVVTTCHLQLWEKKIPRIINRFIMVPLYELCSQKNAVHCGTCQFLF